MHLLILLAQQLLLLGQSLILVDVGVGVHLARVALIHHVHQVVAIFIVSPDGRSGDGLSS